MPEQPKRIGYPFPAADRTFRLTSKDKKSVCLIEEHASVDGKKLVIATELAENKGPPLCKGADDFISAFLEQMTAVDRGKEVIWIEHWSALSYKTDGQYRETFDLVTFTMEGTRAKAVSWTRIFPATIVGRIEEKAENKDTADREFR